ncbi:MAG: beta-N-acetylhexosaminidase [Bacillota bacterium]
MKRKYWINPFLYITMMILLFTGCQSDHQEGEKQEETNPEIPPIEAEIDPIKEKIEQMSLEEKIGQMVIVGLDGYTINEQTKAMIDTYHVGGFILYQDNIEDKNQLLELMNSLKAYNSKNKIPLFLSVDEEGGRVTRMPKELKNLPTAKVIGKADQEALAFQVGQALAEKIKIFGFNMNFAPVLDINNNPKNPVIGDRSFGTEPEVVKRLGISMMQGMQGEGVISVIKHFPGHGDTSVDSHVGLPRVDKNIEELRSFELIPFAEAVKNGADGVMVAHILFPQVDPQYPSSLSKRVVTDILRKELAFNGVIMTDDMTMGAIAENYGIGEAAVMAADAGNDIVLVGHSYEREIEVLNALKAAVESGKLREGKIDESVYRILLLKEKYRVADAGIEAVNVEAINQHTKELINTFQK